MSWHDFLLGFLFGAGTGLTVFAVVGMVISYGRQEQK